MKLKLVIIFLLVAISSLAQDTINVVFHSKFHFQNDYRDFNDELERCVAFLPNRHYSNLADGYYLFTDSITQKIRLKGSVKNDVKVGKWQYFDSLNRLRVEDIFFNDYDSTIRTTYFNQFNKLYLIKESSNKFLKTIHYKDFGISSYYYFDYLDSTNIQMSFNQFGEISHKSSTRNGKKHGEFYWTHKDRSIYARQFFKNGEKVGEWKAKTKGQSKIWCSQTFVEDRLTIISFSSGLSYQIESKEVTVIDKYGNGNVRLKGIVRNGYKIGNWLYFNEQGEKIAEFSHDEKGNVTSSYGKIAGIPSI